MSDSVYFAEKWKDVEMACQYLPAPFRGNPASVAKIEVLDLSGTGGMSGEMSKIVVTPKEEGAKPVSFVLKTTKPAKQSSAMSKSLGLFREAVFYKKCVGVIFDPEAVPTCHYTEWNLDSGRKCMLLEDLTATSGVQAGYFFGTTSFHNKTKDLKELTKDFPEVDELQVCKMAFSIAAKLHGGSWGCKGLVPTWKGAAKDATPVDLLSEEFEFLKGQGWLFGKDKDGWNNSKDYAASQWNAALADKKEQEDGTVLYKGVKYDAAVIDFMQASLLDSTYEDYVASAAKDVVPALTHGDFHPSNFMIVKNPATGAAALKALDFEVIGIGSGPQDLGQFLISHSSSESRRANEDVLLQHYHKELCEVITAAAAAGGGVDAKKLPSLEYVKREYVLGGLGRWAWLMGVCSAVCPPAMNQIFNDQLVDFLADHQEILKANKVVPRP